MCYICNQSSPVLQETSREFSELVGPGCPSKSFEKLLPSEQQESQQLFQANLAAAEKMSPAYVVAVLGFREIRCKRCGCRGHVIVTHANLHRGTILVSCWNPLCEDRVGPAQGQGYPLDIMQLVRMAREDSGYSKEEILETFRLAKARIYEIPESLNEFDPAVLTPLKIRPNFNFWTAEEFKAAGLTFTL